MHQIPRTMAIDWQTIWREPLFRIGLFVKIVLILFCVPTIQEQWFVPFVVSVIEQPTFSPWTQFLQQGGDPLAFPYGPIMLLAHLPTVLLGYFADWAFGVNYFAAVGFRISLLLADLLILFLLSQMFTEYLRKLVIYYWLSPILIYITYWHGQTDIVPVSFLILGLFLLRINQIKTSAISVAFAIAAKISMVIIVPFFLIYLWINKKLRNFTIPFALILGLMVLLIQGSFLLTSGLQEMLLGNREIGKIYLLSVQFSENVQLYFTPLVYLTALYLIWRIKRMNFELLLAVMGVAFFIIILMTPAPIGWFIWLIPFFAIHQLRAGKTATVLISGLAILLISYHLFETNNAHIQSIWFTLISTTGLILAIQMLREGVHNNDYYKLSRQALAVGISGDSGSGKDTLALALEKLFGKHSVAQISGDDYHLWDRKAPMWQALTHLNPRANNLFQFSKDVLSLIHGSNITTRHYNHETGLFNQAKKLQTNDVIIISGLHALYSKTLCEKMDVRIYLQRDTKQRGHSRINKRQQDAQKYIHPQKQQADIIFSLMPVNPDLLNNNNKEVPLKLKVILVNGVFYQALAKILIGVCNLHLNINLTEAASQVELDIEGEVEAEDIALAAKMMMPHMEELLDLQPKWQKNMLGIMQLITLAQISEVLRDRK